MQINGASNPVKL
uniref:Uncharacterized protein n=1 Tax=Rhizophora mucronata TaxID=61149 RepID=A0A2P2Q066_RHIMU